jgi:hypothetical protein
MRSILFYISGHGYGHAVRAGEVIRALQRIRPDWRILARTEAPPHLLPEGVSVTAGEFESGVVEREAGVVMDEQATLERLKSLVGRWDQLKAEEIRFAAGQQIDLIVADIPPMAGDIAAVLGVPCIAIANFTWDWIYEPYATEYLQHLRQGYSRMQVLLRLPFSQSSRLDVFPTIVEAPLIARKAQVRGKPGNRVLLGSRAQVSAAALAAAAASAPEYDFVTPGPGENFTEVLASCDLAIAKLGFSMLAECIAHGKPLLYPPREHFREEAILQQHVNDHIPACPIPLQDFYAGNWGKYLRELARQPSVPSRLRADGAEFCAQYLVSYLENQTSF